MAEARAAGRGDVRLGAHTVCVRQKGHPILAREPGGGSLETEGRVKVGGQSGAWGSVAGSQGSQRVGVWEGQGAATLQLGVT